MRVHWIWYPASPSRIIVFIENAMSVIVIKSRKKGKNAKRDKKQTRVGHMTEQKRRENVAKCCSVSFQRWMNQWNCSMWTKWHNVWGKNSLIIGSEMCYVFDFFLKHRCYHRSKRIEALRFHHTGKAIRLLLHGIRFVSKHLMLLEHRVTSSAGKPVSILRGKGEKIWPLLPSW